MKIKGEDILFAILIALTCLGLLTSCEYYPEDDPVIYEWYIDENYDFEPQAIIISESKYQHVYLDTTESYTYFQIYAEANEMPERKRYNGENNIWATFSTPKYWLYSDNNISNEPVYYISSTSVRFDYPRVFNNRTTGYQPQFLDLYTKQNVGPIPVQAIKQRDTVPIYMDVSFDGDYHVKDTLFIVLQPR
jgi:hypothetical protein